MKPTRRDALYRLSGWVRWVWLAAHREQLLFGVEVTFELAEETTDGSGELVVRLAAFAGGGPLEHIGAGPQPRMIAV